MYGVSLFVDHGIDHRGAYDSGQKGIQSGAASLVQRKRAVQTRFPVGRYSTGLSEAAAKELGLVLRVGLAAEVGSDRKHRVPALICR